MKEIKRWIQRLATRLEKNQKENFSKNTLLGMFSSVQQGHGWLYHCRRNEVRINKVQ